MQYIWQSQCKGERQEQNYTGIGNSTTWQPESIGRNKKKPGRVNKKINIANSVNVYFFFFPLSFFKRHSLHKMIIGSIYSSVYKTCKHNTCNIIAQKDGEGGIENTV